VNILSQVYHQEQRTDKRVCDKLEEVSTKIQGGSTCSAYSILMRVENSLFLSGVEPMSSQKSKLRCLSPSLHPFRSMGTETWKEVVQMKENEKDRILHPECVVKTLSRSLADRLHF
jgi:hypothetical protein